MKKKSSTSTIPSCIGLLPNRKTRQRQLDHEYQASEAQESQEQECCGHTIQKRRRYIDTCVPMSTMSSLMSEQQE